MRLGSAVVRLRVGGRERGMDGGKKFKLLRAGSEAGSEWKERRALLLLGGDEEWPMIGWVVHALFCRGPPQAWKFDRVRGYEGRYGESDRYVKSKAR